MKEIKLKFKNVITSLAGNSYGKTIFNEQVGDIDFQQSYNIIFPEQIINIATSFIQGFFEEFVKEIGISGIEKQITITSSIENLKSLIIDCLI